VHLDVVVHEGDVSDLQSAYGGVGIVSVRLEVDPERIGLEEDAGHLDLPSLPDFVRSGRLGATEPPHGAMVSSPGPVVL